MKRTKTGEIVNKIDEKTSKVRVIRRMVHPLYKKVVKVSKLYLVHNPDNLGDIGQKVVIVETRPISKMKSWRIKGLVEKK